MKVFIFSDGHGNLENLKLAKAFIDREGFDLLLFAGDFTKFGHEKTGIAYMEEVLSYKKAIFAVMGNCDFQSLLEFGLEKNILVDGRIREFQGFFVSGSGGGSYFTGTSPYERKDEALASDLSLVETKVTSKEVQASKLIVLSHNPPLDTKLDQIQGGIHVGSPLIRQFIERTQPLLFVSGHIHEAVGVDKLGKTSLINPGALVDGRFATCEIVESEKGYEVVNVQFDNLSNI